MCFGLIYLFEIHSIPLKSKQKGNVVSTHKTQLGQHMQGYRSKLQHNTFGVRKTPHYKQLCSPQLFTIGCHSDCPLSPSRHHMSLRWAVDVAAGAAQVTGKDFKLTPKARKQVLVSLGQVFCRRFKLKGNHCTAGRGDSNICNLALIQSMHISGGLQAG